jgi:hypothetical protein
MDIQKTMQNLRRNNFDTSFFETAEEGAAYLCGEIRGTTVGIGGSMTLMEMDIYNKLLEAGNDVAWHLMDEEHALEIIDRAAKARIYLSSANAISETGEIVNIDGRGNRVAATLSGHERVYIVAGVNKIVSTIDDAIYRARNVAAPLNSRRLRKKTPCAVGELKCHDCASPDRICRGLTILLGKPSAIDKIEIVLINQSLGY